jgi:hypothetical protein
MTIHLITLPIRWIAKAIKARAARGRPMIRADRPNKSRTLLSVRNVMRIAISKPQKYKHKSTIGI